MGPRCCFEPFWKLNLSIEGLELGSTVTESWDQGEAETQFITPLDQTHSVVNEPNAGPYNFFYQPGQGGQ